MTTYSDALNTIYSYIRYSTTLDTARPQRTQAVLERIGNPQANLKIIHVTGTKGKGSSCVMMAAALQANGYRVGLYTSPHLHTLRERLQINSVPISQDDLVRLVDQLKPHFDAVDGIGFPEVMTCLALQYFAEQSIDIAIIEVHVGGRYDATNVFIPIASVITTIDYDHTDFLGGTLESIATHKAGIIKLGVPVISAPQTDDVYGVIHDQASLHKAPFIHVEDFHVHSASLDGQSIDIQLKDGKTHTFSTSLIGQMQGINLAVAVSSLDNLPFAVDFDRAQAGLNHVQWGGRMELLSESPLTLIDIAHNAAAATVLRDTVDQIFPDQRRVFIYGSKANKDIRHILKTLIRPQDHIILTQVHDPDTEDPHRLADIVRELQLTDYVTVVPLLADALRTELADESAVRIITGSIFIVAAARAILLNISPETGSAH